MNYLNDIETIISTIIDKEGKLMDFLEGGDYQEFNHLFNLLSDDHPILNLKGKKFHFSLLSWDSNTDVKEIVDIVYHMEMMGLLYNTPDSSNPTFTPFDEMQEEALGKMRELIISSINSEAFKSLNESNKNNKLISKVNNILDQIVDSQESDQRTFRQRITYNGEIPDYAPGLLRALKGEHPVSNLIGKTIETPVMYGRYPNADIRDIYISNNEYIIYFGYHDQIYGSVKTVLRNFSEEALVKFVDHLSGSLNTDVIKSLNENVKYEKDIEDIDKKLETEEDKYQRRMLLKRKEGIRDRIEDEIVGLLYTILRTNDLIIGVDKTPMIQYFKDKGVETGLIDIVNEPIKYSGMTTYIKEIYLDYGTCFIIFDNTGTEYKQLIQKIKIDKILAIYKTMLTVINRPVLKKLQEGLKEDYLETPDKSEIDWRSPLHIELANTFNNLINMIIDKYKIDINSSKTVSILKEIEKLDRKSPLINLIGKVLRTIGEEAEEFVLKDIISYSNEDQFMIAFEYHDHFIIDYPSRMKFAVLYPIYEEIITTLNARVLRDLNEGMKEDYIKNKKIMKFGDYFDGSVQSASYDIYKMSEKLLDTFEDLILKIVDKYNIDITSNDARSGLFSVLEKEHPNSPILELKEHVFKTVKDNREFTLFEIYSDREPKIRYNFSYINEPYQIHDSPALDFELLYPIYEKLLTVLNAKALQDLNI